MATDAKGLKTMGVAAAALGGLAIITMVSVAVVQGFGNSGQADNATANLFVTGLTVFATFASLIALSLVGKIIYSLWRGGL